MKYVEWRTVLTAALVIGVGLEIACHRGHQGAAPGTIDTSSPAPGAEVKEALPDTRRLGGTMVVAERDSTAHIFDQVYKADVGKVFIVAKYHTQTERQYQGLDTGDFVLTDSTGKAYSALGTRRFSIFQTGRGFFSLAFEVPEKAPAKGWRISYKGGAPIPLTSDTLSPRRSIDLPCEFATSEVEQAIIDEAEMQMERFRECLIECAKAEDRDACVDLCRAIYLQKKPLPKIPSD